MKTFKINGQIIKALSLTDAVKSCKDSVASEIYQELHKAYPSIPLSLETRNFSLEKLTRIKFPKQEGNGNFYTFLKYLEKKYRNKYPFKVEFYSDEIRTYEDLKKDAVKTCEDSYAYHEYHSQNDFESEKKYWNDFSNKFGVKYAFAGKNGSNWTIRLFGNRANLEKALSDIGYNTSEITKLIRDSVEDAGSFSIIDVDTGEKFGNFSDIKSATIKAIQYKNLGLGDHLVIVDNQSKKHFSLEKNNTLKSLDSIKDAAYVIYKELDADDRFFIRSSYGLTVEKVGGGKTVVSGDKKRIEEMISEVPWKGSYVKDEDNSCKDANPDVSKTADYLWTWERSHTLSFKDLQELNFYYVDLRKEVENKLRKGYEFQKKFLNSQTDSVEDGRVVNTELAKEINRRFVKELNTFDGRVYAEADGIDLSEISASEDTTKRIINFVKSKGKKVNYTPDDAFLEIFDSLEDTKEEDEKAEKKIKFYL